MRQQAVVASCRSLALLQCQAPERIRAIPLLVSGDADRIYKSILCSHGFYGSITFSILMVLVDLHKTFMGKMAGLALTHIYQ